MRKNNGVVFLTKEECYGSLIKLYDTVAKKLGYKPGRDIDYDCKNINVTENVLKMVTEYYRKEIGVDDVQLAALYLCFGPKACVDSDYGEYVAIVHDGFIVKEDSGE